MKKSLFATSSLLLALFLFSCTGKNKEPEVVYQYEEKTNQLSPELREKIGDWAEEGSDCFGILALIDGDGVMQEGAVIKARILRFKGDSVKMKSLESIQLREVEGCTQMGIGRGDTWWETEGDVYQSAEEAQAHLEKALNGVTL